MWARPYSCPVLASLEEADRLCEQCVVAFLPGERHIAFQKRDDLLRDGLPRRDGIHQHVWVSLLRKDTTGLEDFACELEETTSIPVLIDEELRIDEKAVG